MWLTQDGTPIETLEELESGSDRTIAVVSASIVESLIEDVLKKALCTDETGYGRHVQNYAFSPDGMIGTFGSKITLLFLMGFLTEDAHRDLLNLKYLRNKFAHYSENHSFGLQPVKDRCANFRLIKSRIKAANAFTVNKEGKRIETTSVSKGVDGLFLHIPDYANSISSARGQFVSTAKLLCAAFSPVLNGEKISKPAI
jgi:hypothetical protein